MWYELSEKVVYSLFGLEGKLAKASHFFIY